MATSYKYKVCIGRAEPISFLLEDGEITNVPAKVDSGAFSSSIWASDIQMDGSELTFALFDKGHPAYTGRTIRTKKFQTVIIENSFGHRQERYGVMLKVSFCGKRFETFFTLSDRSKKIYPVLVGRKLLKGRFIVDVSIGHPVADEETEEALGFEGLKNRVRTK